MTDVPWPRPLPQHNDNQPPVTDDLHRLILVGALLAQTLAEIAGTLPDL